MSDRTGHRLRGEGRRRAAGIALSVALLTALVVLVPREDRPRLDPVARLEAFHEGDVAPGIWAIEGVFGERVVHVAPHPLDEGCLVTGHERDGEVRYRTWPRESVAGFLVPARPELFFRNHRLAGPVTWTEGPGGRRLLAAVWRPRVDRAGETARHVLIDPRDGNVVAVEDRSHLDHVIRAVHRTDVSPAPLGEAIAPCRSEGRGHGPGRWGGGEPDPARVAARAGFPVLVPTYVPEGYELLWAGVRRWPMRGRDGARDGDGGRERRVRLASLVYGDGLGTFSIGMGQPADMDRLEQAVSTMRAEREDPEACPTLPGSQRPVKASGLVIRRRRDRCRTVLRIDDLEGVSVALLASNELPEDEYLRVMTSLEVVVPAPAEAGAADQGDDGVGSDEESAEPDDQR